jgi:hypothetical protein
MQLCALTALLWAAWAGGMAPAVGAAEPLTLLSDGKIHPLPAGQELRLAFRPVRTHSLAIRVVLRDADFAGATLRASVNGREFPPYHAFGGDTRYDNVRERPDLHPPVARLEANYVMVEEWVVKGENRLVLVNDGPGAASVGSITAREVSGHDLPRYCNPIHFDFDVWRQASVMRPGIPWNLDAMLLGVIPGGGTQILNYSGGGSLPLKLQAEDARVNWGFARSTFYSVWHLVNNAKEWCQFIDLDQRKETFGKIHSQFVNPPDVPAGTDLALIKPDGYLNALRAGVEDLGAYSTDYNFSCEQWGPRGQGFGKWWGDAHAGEGYDARRWADNYQAEFNKLAALAHRQDPSAWVMAPHWWGADIRFLLYDTALERGFKMRDMTDALMTHYYSFPFADFAPDGKPTMDEEKKPQPVARPELQYPGGRFEPPDFDRSRCYMGTWVLIPEIAIDWNRYRLGRTEKDLKPGSGVDPKVNRWADGRPFRFEAGFDGDERLYNNETCLYDRQYSAPAPFQFLYAMFSYSLLPTAGSEPSEFQITRTLPLTPGEPAAEDIFSEVQVPINRYGEWVSGAAHTHRLRTRDPLYGDLFGYTGFEQATTGDYIWLCGIKDRHHRRPGANAWNLVRRTCYAFVTAAEVFPACVNDPDTRHLFVKVLKLKQGGRDVLGVYAVNNDRQPHRLDLTLPVKWDAPVTTQCFDASAADWADAREEKLAPKDGQLRIQAELPPVSPWLRMIYPPDGAVVQAFTPLATPRLKSPWGNQNVAEPEVTLRWGPAQPSARYEVQLASEMLFRSQDMVETKGGLEIAEHRVAAKLAPNRRYHWRVRALDEKENSTAWAQPQSFWFQAAAPVVPPPAPEAPASDGDLPRVANPLLPPFTDPDNLAHRGVCFSHPNYWEGAAEAVDGFEGSCWLPDETDAAEGRKPAFPCWWAVRFKGDETIGSASLLWAEKLVAKDFDFQTWSEGRWKTEKAFRNNSAARVDVGFDPPLRTRAIRLWITAPLTNSCGLAEVCLKKPLR